ncbi:MAG: hypothetical protein HQ510_00925 [Candidatus Marinimicrobia bacterium]|nr:hypothetical protein [Candidatus Neomarinimicrobiota bacterium]
MQKATRLIILLPIIFMSQLISGDAVDHWADHYLTPLDSTQISVQFLYRVVNDFSEYNLPGSLIVGENRSKFRYTLGPKTTLFDGTDWLLFDDRTNQVIIESGNGRPMMMIPQWVVPDSVKTLNRSPGSSPMECMIYLPEVSDSVIVQFSQADSSLEKITFKYEMSEVWITDILLTVPDRDTDWFFMDTTGKYILDLRE